MLQYSFKAGAPATVPAGSEVQPWLIYSALPDRPPIRWPGDARLALWVCPCFVFYEFVPPTNPWLNAWARTPAPDVMGYSRQEYGNRVGFWRMLEVLDKHAVKCTAVVNTQALEHFPEVTRAIVDRRWAIAGHGKVNTQFVYGYSAQEELNYYREMKSAVRRLTGVDMIGMGGAGPQAATPHTPDVLAEAGYRYYTDFFSDDQPFPLRVRSGRLISMPYTAEINDTLVFGAGGEADQFCTMIERQFEQLMRDAEHTGLVMCISLHPNLIGQPQRIRWLDRALAAVSRREGVWYATGDEIANYYLEHCYDAMVANLGDRWSVSR